MKIIKQDELDKALEEIKKSPEFIDASIQIDSAIKSIMKDSKFFKLTQEEQIAFVKAEFEKEKK